MARRTARFVGLDGETLRRREDGTDRCRHVPGVQEAGATLVLDGGDAGEPSELILAQPLDRVEAYGPLVEPAADELVDRPGLEDPAVIHDRQPVAEDLRFLHVVRREEHRSTAEL